MKRIIEASELVLNPDGSIYHLHLKPEHLAKDIIIVGDPDRVPEVSKHFDTIEFKVSKREFVTHTGSLDGKRISVISTGIGTDNIDIVFNELDALVNIDFETRTEKDELTSLNIVRVGTSGTVQKEIPVNSILLSTFGLGLEGLLNFYMPSNSKTELEMLATIKTKVKLPIEPSLSSASEKLLNHFKQADFFEGITLTATGFYGPQGRMLRLQPKISNFIDDLAQLDLNGNRVTNLEMETAGIYGLGKLLGHHCLSVNVILANRQHRTFSSNPKEAVQKAIQMSLEKMISL